MLPVILADLRMKFTLTKYIIGVTAVRIDQNVYRKNTFKSKRQMYMYMRQMGLKRLKGISL